MVPSLGLFNELFNISYGLRAGAEIGSYRASRASAGPPNVWRFVRSYKSSARQLLWVLEAWDSCMFHLHQPRPGLLMRTPI